MDAGGCGWSAQRLHPDGPVCLQRDYDGTPMVTDVMGDETCRNLARELGRRNSGFMQMSMATADPFSRSERARDARRTEPASAAFSGAGLIRSRPQIHRFLIAWFDHCHARGLRVYPQAH